MEFIWEFKWAEQRVYSIGSLSERELEEWNGQERFKEIRMPFYSLKISNFY